MSLFALILAMGVVTYLPRVLPLLALSGRPIPPRVRLFLEGFPVAVLAAFVAPLILAPDGQIDLSLSNTELVVAVPTAAVALGTRSLIATVLVGSLLMAALRAF